MKGHGLLFFFQCIPKWSIKRLGGRWVNLEECGYKIKLQTQSESKHLSKYVIHLLGPLSQRTIRRLNCRIDDVISLINLLVSCAWSI